MQLAQFIDIGSPCNHTDPMQYRIDPKAFKRALANGGIRSLRDFADQSGLHRNTLNNVLRGQSVFTHSVQQIADRLGCDPLDLITPATASARDLPYIEELSPMLAEVTRGDSDLGVMLFGSRARGTAATYADWDIGLLRWPKPLTHTEFVHYKGQIEDLTDDVVRLVDVVNLQAAPDWFWRSIAADIRRLEGSAAAWAYCQGVMNGLQRSEQATAGAKASA